MPELAEVEFYRKEWDCGLNQKILAVHLHSTKRVFRETDTRSLQAILEGSTFLASEAHGKQMMFSFSRGGWMGVHLGMSGKLRVEHKDFVPGKHDHLVLRQERQALVYHDPRLFGRVLFEKGEAAPKWWKDLPPRVTADDFTFTCFSSFLQRHTKLSIKAVLLMQNGFPGVGNWMADEILWQARIFPGLSTGTVKGPLAKSLFEKTKFVCSEALKTIGEDFSDPPAAWLFRYRWKKKGNCPRCKSQLNHSTIGGRTTCWCPKCQRKK